MWEILMWDIDFRCDTSSAEDCKTRKKNSCNLKIFYQLNYID